MSSSSEYANTVSSIIRVFLEPTTYSQVYAVLVFGRYSTRYLHPSNCVQIPYWH